MQCVCVGFATINVMLATCMLARWTLNGRVPEACWASKEVAVQSVSGIGLLSVCAISKVEQPEYSFASDNVLHFSFCSQIVYLERMFTRAGSRLSKRVLECLEDL